ncbi:MAG: nucleotidyltransferase domain-containing protein [Bacteroidetes bacterium]|nr:nucleotidyltransferase domain-containing protein [Bacteroidota bacterium]MBU2583779.1 nucleotidyltransferase domain-containing protein [Bacteroidota bacterium]
MDILSKYNSELKTYCNKNRIKKFSLFGSYLKNAYDRENDIDLLIEFEDDTEYGLLDVARMERELSEIIGKKVDLRTPEELSRYFRDTVVKEAKVRYKNNTGE